jgi:hypothetical protein
MMMTRRMMMMTECRWCAERDLDSPPSLQNHTQRTGTATKHAPHLVEGGGREGHAKKALPASGHGVRIRCLFLRVLYFCVGG